MQNIIDVGKNEKKKPKSLISTAIKLFVPLEFLTKANYFAKLEPVLLLGGWSASAMNNLDSDCEQNWDTCWQ